MRAHVVPFHALLTDSMYVVMLIVPFLTRSCALGGGLDKRLALGICNIVKVT